MSRPIHTQFAMKAIDLAGLFKAMVGGTSVDATDNDPFTPELSAPDGPSTGGGAQSVQHIKLMRQGLVVVAGSVDSVERTSELRSLNYLSAMHAQRYKGAALPIGAPAYDAFLKRVREFLKQQGVDVVVKDAAPVAPPPAKSGMGPGVIIGALAIVVGIAVAAYLLVGR